MAFKDAAGKARIGPFERVESVAQPGTFYTPTSGTAKRVKLTTGLPTPTGPSGPTFEASTCANAHHLDYDAMNQGAIPRPAQDPMAYFGPPTTPAPEQRPRHTPSAPIDRSAITSTRKAKR